MMFPQLYVSVRREAREGNMVNRDYVKALYDYGIYPAIKKTLPPKNQQFWPVSFDSEVFRALNDRGKVSFAQRQIPEEYSDAFFEALYQMIDEMPELSWATGFFLQIQVQGTKEATAHNVQVPQESFLEAEGYRASAEDERLFRLERTRQIARALRPIDMRKLKAHNWVIDIATTVSLDEAPFSLLIRKETHPRLISLLMGISTASASELIEGGARKGYYFDEFFHTGLFGGMRLTMPADVWSPWKAHYAQAYTTDKTLTAHKDKGKYAKELDPAWVFRNMRGADEKFLKPLAKLSREAVSERRPIHIRLETRVRLPFAWDVHRRYDPSILSLLTSKVGNSSVWGWRHMRVQSIRAVFTEYQRTIDSVPRTLLPTHASLIIGLTWMTNALINRPKEGSEWNVLRDTLCVHEQIDDVIVATRPLNAFFLHSVILDPCPRISTHRYLSIKSLKTLLALPRGSADSELVSLVAGNRGRKDNSEAVEADKSFTRVLVNKAARMITHIPDDAPKVFTEEEVAQIPGATTEHQYESEKEDPQQQHETLSNQRSLDSIFQRMGAEIVRKVPSTKEGRSWRKISDEEASRLQWDVLCDASQVGEVMVGWKQVVDKDRWNRVVDKLFPDVERYREKTMGGAHYLQNLAQCSWFQDYKDILEDRFLSIEEKNAITATARKKLREEAEWLPLGKADKMWGDGLKREPLHGVGIGPLVPSIVINPSPRNRARRAAHT
ncbi:unnamed protein product [Rhizoctonia solani]|uniref:Uncharacterized protein n=1 Tax=Rhizoctonia solani TaxID=456999 RepID=A0A8H3AGJ4_9AGAM|nr:unnamed protein product [Rhizoctonia solani]